MKNLIYHHKFLDIGLYKVYRLWEQKPEINLEKSIYSFPGLLPVSNNPDIEVGFWKSNDWQRMAEKTFHFALMSLLISRDVTLQLVRNETVSFFGLYKRKRKQYQLINNSSDEFIEDPFSRSIYQSIVKGNKLYPDRCSLTHVVRLTFDVYLGRGEHNRPGKVWLKRMLKGYSREFSWMKMETESSFLGLVSHNEYDLQSEQLQDIIEEHRLLRSHLLRLSKQDAAWTAFAMKVFAEVESDLRRREPKNDD